MKFTVTTTPDLPKILRENNAPNAHEFPWDEVTEVVAKTGEVASFPIPADYWVERGDDKAKLKVASLKTRVRNHYNSWVAKDEEKRSKLELLLSSIPASLDLMAYVRTKAE